jgi:advillin
MFPLFTAYRINKKIIVPMEAHLLDREILNLDRSYILDCGSEIFLWMGMTALVSERKTSVTSLEVSRMKSGNFPFCYTEHVLV